MMITGFYVKRQKRAYKMPKSHVEGLGTAWLVMHMMPATPVMASTGNEIVGRIAATTFGPGGPGVLIISLLLMALVGWLAGYIAQAAGKGQIAGMIHVVTIFSCIGLVADAALKALGSLAKFLG